MRLEIPTPPGTAWADIDACESPVATVILGHGAGGGVDAPDLLAVRSAALAAGIAVVRVTQPYRVAGRRAPAPAGQLDAAWLAVVTVLRREGIATAPLVVGGRSSGARVACRTATAAGAAAVVALAFPVHPPGRPDLTRLPELELPTVAVLVVQGDRDPFGMPPPAPGRDVVAVAGDHSLRRAAAATAAAVVRFIQAVTG